MTMTIVKWNGLTNGLSFVSKITKEKLTPHFFIAVTVDTKNTESSLMASSPIEGGNSIKAVMKPLQTVGKYSWLLFIPTLDSQHQFW